MENKSEVLSDIQKLSIICLLIAICSGFHLTKQWILYIHTFPTVSPRSPRWFIFHCQKVKSGFFITICGTEHHVCASLHSLQQLLQLQIQSGDIFNSWFGLATAAANFDSLLRSLVIVKRHLKCV